jgi:hypothetical protein
VKCVILQPSYLPWRGYFHQIQKADTFVFFDDVQYDRRGWRNRNKIKTPAGPKWLTIPVRSVDRQAARILDIEVSSDQDWRRDHMRTIRHAYSKAPFFDQYEPMLRSWYSRSLQHLADFTIETTIELARELGIRHTRFLRSSTLNCSGRKTDRLLEILRRVGAQTYISGPSAKSYLDVDLLAQNGISVEWMIYEYPEYPQFYVPFEPQVSALDLLLMTGSEAGCFIWGRESHDDSSNGTRLIETHGAKLRQ